jgi:hypothetical protein
MNKQPQRIRPFRVGVDLLVTVEMQMQQVHRVMPATLRPEFAVVHMFRAGQATRLAAALAAFADDAAHPGRDRLRAHDAFP